MVARVGAGIRIIPATSILTNPAGETGFAPGPEGATAPETLRAMDRGGT
jgi:hypothetical protein